MPLSPYDHWREFYKSRTLVSNDSLAGQVQRSCDASEKYKELVGEIIATLCLPQNQVTFKDLPKEFHELVSAWKSRFEKIKGAE